MALEPKKAWINDVNSELMNVWEIIKNNVNQLKNHLDEFTKNHNNAVDKKAFYLEQRNRIISDDFENASRFIYRNKTCFNGLYRVNSKNEFNVPFNSKKQFILKLYESDNLDKISELLKNTTISCLDYKEVISKARKNDFLYLDPPYVKEDDKTQIFTAYTKNGFDDVDQVKLKELLVKADKRGVKWILSNHKSTLISALYKDFNQIEVSANRFINSDSSKRKNSATELIISNFISKED